MNKQEAIKILKEFHDTSALFSVRTALETVFPELKDEDELEWLKQFIQEEVDSLSIDIRDNEDQFRLKMLKRSLEWLEKQGEQKIPVEMKTPEESLGIDSKTYNEIVNDCLYNDESKPTPRFHEGEWVVDNNGKVAIIYDLQKAGYVGHYTNGTDFVCKYGNEHLLHLWTIQDAKDGDILQLGEVTAIFKEYIGNGYCKCYCSICEGEFEILIEEAGDNIFGCINTTPATNAQRALLFQKMKEAGYEWDADKKELKKVDRTKDLSNYIKFLKSFHCWNKIQREIIDKYLEEQIKKNYSSKEDEKVDNERKPLYGRGDIIEYRGCPYFIEEVVTPKENIFYYNVVSLCFGETSRRISIGAEGEKDIILISNNRFDYEKANIQQKDFAPKASTANRQVYNRAILKILSNYVEKYPDTRFGQMLYNLGVNPHFNEESRETYCNLNETINKRK